MMHALPICRDAYNDEHTVEMVGTVVWYQPAKEME